jgi:7,8-dihydropterin-6-yl-methyl-4-(beta-D-ribofuranosyl)aminobenzene 5'-phosphate synthase
MKTFFTLFTACLLSLAIIGPACSTDTGKVKISVLCDDEAVSDKYLTEHGVSILVELANGHRWLFDTGSTDIYLQNAKIMGANLDDLSGIAISHGHEDHSGGLIFYSLLKGKPPIYGHPYIWHPEYDIVKDQPVRVIGMPTRARKLAWPSFKPVNNVTKLDENLYFFTDVPREPGSYVPTHGKFFNADGTGACPIIDDATLVVKTPKGIVALFGCGHAGYTNILKAIQKEFPNDKLLAAIGGLHLKGADEKALSQAVEFTDKVKARDFVFCGSHCTGKKTIELFTKHFGDKVVKKAGSGTVLEFPAVE